MEKEEVLLNTEQAQMRGNVVVDRREDILRKSDEVLGVSVLLPLLLRPRPALVVAIERVVLEPDDVCVLASGADLLLRSSRIFILRRTRPGGGGGGREDLDVAPVDRVLPSSLISASWASSKSLLLLLLLLLAVLVVALVEWR
jgi:hypothetical protein